MQFEATSIVLSAGCLSVFAVLISKILNFCNRKNSNIEFKNAYECGIERKNEKFKYMSHNIIFILLSLILEFIVVLLALCCFLDIKDSSWHGAIFIRILLTVLLLSIILSYQIAIRKSK